MLNASRARWTMTVAFLQALRMQKASQLPLEIFDTIAQSEEEAREVQYDANSKAVIAETIANSRRGAF